MSVSGRIVQEGPRSEMELSLRVPVCEEEADALLSEFLIDRSLSPAWAERDADGLMDAEA